MRKAIPVMNSVLRFDPRGCRLAPAITTLSERVQRT
jgi:hypothetical protein